MLIRKLPIQKTVLRQLAKALTKEFLAYGGEITICQTTDRRIS